MQPLARVDQPTMTNDAFEAWALEREWRWELIGGVPVQMQAEGTAHSRTARRIAILLEKLLDGRPCTPDERIDVICGEGEIRNPDVLIDCDPRAATTNHSRAYRPVAVFEVAVTSQAYDMGGKHLVYFNNPHVRQYVVILPLERAVLHIARGEAGRTLRSGETLELGPEPGLALAVDDLLIPSESAAR